MDSWLSVGFIMGAVQGLTEFLPISSTGHLVIAGNLLGFTGDKASTFSVAIQLGSILAVAVLYRQRFLGLLFPKGRSGLAGKRGIGLLLLTTLPACAAGLLLRSHIKTLFTPASVAAALDRKSVV